jgi:hypothetical protein
MHFNGVCAREGGVLQLVALLSSLLLEGLVDLARKRGCMSLSWSMSCRLSEKAGKGIMLKLNMGGVALGGFFGQWLANRGAIDSLSSGLIQAGTNGGALVVEADMVDMGWT